MPNWDYTDDDCCHKTQHERELRSREKSRSLDYERWDEQRDIDRHNAYREAHARQEARRKQ